MIKISDSKPYLIGEIGINHNGDMQIAKKLMDAVNACGWDCAKYQKRNPDICVPEKQKGVMRDTPWGKMKYIDYKYKIEFEKSEYDEIDVYCKNKPIEWTVSVWDLDSLNFISNYEVPFLKIPSALLTDTELLAETAKSGNQVIISTGMSTLSEVDEAVNIVEKHGQKPVVLHCHSSYPAPHDELNLSIIPFYKERYDCIVGYSGHENDLEPSVIAVSLGAQVIERHITIDHGMWGTDQKSSLEILAMDMLAKRMKDIKAIIGTPDKKIMPSEEEARIRLKG